MRQQRVGAWIGLVVFALLWFSATQTDDQGRTTAPSLILPFFVIAAGFAVWLVVLYRRRQ